MVLKEITHLSPPLEHISSEETRDVSPEDGDAEKKNNTSATVKQLIDLYHL